MSTPPTEIKVSAYDIEVARRLREVLDELIDWQNSGLPSPHKALYKRIRREQPWYRPNSDNYVEDLPDHLVMPRFCWQEILNGLYRGWTQRALWVMVEGLLEEELPALIVVGVMDREATYTLDDALTYAALNVGLKRPNARGTIDVNNL